MADGDSVVDVSEYASALKRSWMWIVVAGLIGALLGTLLVGLQKSNYESTARVEVQPLLVAGDDPNLDVDRQVNMKTEETVAASQRVAERAAAITAAAAQLGTSVLDNPEVIELADTIDYDDDLARNLQNTVEVEAVFDSQILEITASASSPTRAQEKAQSIAYAYLQVRTVSGEAKTVDSLHALEDRKVEIIAELDDIVNEIARAGADSARAEALRYRTVPLEQELLVIGSLLGNSASLTISPGVVLDDAEVPRERAGIPPITGPVGGFLVGAFVGIALAYLRDRQDDRVRDPGVELASMGLAVMGDVPVGRGMFRRGSDSGVASIDEVAAEQYRRVQNSLLFNLDSTDKSVILVAGTNNPQSSTTVAANLAAAAARSGRRTLIIGADLRKASLHDRFNAPNHRGLSDVLTGNAQLAVALQSLPDIPNLRLLSAGTAVSQPAQLLQSEVLGRLVASVRREFDLVVFEAPPVLYQADAVDLARLCDGAVLVVEPARATRGGVADSVEQLRRVGAQVIGTIIAKSSGS